MTEMIQDQGATDVLDRPWEAVTITVHYLGADGPTVRKASFDRAKMEEQRQQRKAAEAPTVEARDRALETPLSPDEFRAIILNYASQSTISPIEEDGPQPHVMSLLPAHRIARVDIEVTNLESGIVLPGE